MRGVGVVLAGEMQAGNKSS